MGAEAGAGAGAEAEAGEGWKRLSYLNTGDLLWLELQGSGCSHPVEI